MMRMSALFFNSIHSSTHAAHRTQTVVKSKSSTAIKTDYVRNAVNLFLSMVRHQEMKEVVVLIVGRCVA